MAALPILLGIARDNKKTWSKRSGKELSADMLLVSGGGFQWGDYDFVKDVLKVWGLK